MKKEQTGKCDPCEQNFERNVHNLVKEGSAPTRAERMKKESEVKTAFAEHKTTASPAAKPTPAVAGAMKKK